jgi:hypothetical protein
VNGNALQAGAIVLSAMLAVGGWLFNAYKDREFKKFELRTKYRIEMLELALEAILSINEPTPTAHKIVSTFSAARSKISIFGTDEEFLEFERLLSLIEKNSGGTLVGKNLNAFPKLLVSNFRREIGLPERHSTLVPKD